MDDDVNADEGTSGPAGMSRAEADRLARALANLVQAAQRVLYDEPRTSPALDAISAHLGVDYDMATLVTASWPIWHHVSVHRGVTAYLADVSPDAEWIGVSGTHREHNDLMSVLSQERGGRSHPARPDYVSAPCGPAETEDVISFGIVCTRAPSGAAVVLVLRMTELHGPTNLALEVLAAERPDATAVLDVLRQSVDRYDVLRGQVLSFGVSEDYGNSLVTFLPRPRVSAADVVLPVRLLEQVEAHVAGTAEHAERLRALGLHLKRGLLLHGPPGTGKTHLVRYLIGRLTETTVVVLSGASLHRIEAAAALARKLAPTLVVVEDVDLIAEDRSYSPTGTPMLFSLLDAMDGVAADADVALVLTTTG